MVKNKTKRVAFQGHLSEAIIIASLKIREEAIERVLNAAMFTKVANDNIVPELECCGGALVLSLVLSLLAAIATTCWRPIGLSVMVRTIGICSAAINCA